MMTNIISETCQKRKRQGREQEDDHDVAAKKQTVSNALITNVMIFLLALYITFWDFKVFDMNLELLHVIRL